MFILSTKSSLKTSKAFIIIHVIIVYFFYLISKFYAVLAITASKFGSTVSRLITESISMKESNPKRLLKPFWIALVISANFHPPNTIFFPSALVFKRLFSREFIFAVKGKKSIVRGDLFPRLVTKIFFVGIYFRS